MNMKHVLLLLLFFGSINAANPFSFGPYSTPTPFSWGGMASSGAKFVFNNLNNHKTEIVCQTINKVTDKGTIALDLATENMQLKAENAELKCQLSTLKKVFDDVEKHSKEVMVGTHKLIDMVERMNPVCVAVDNLGITQLHMLAAFEESEQKPGFFTKKYHFELSKNPAYKNTFDMSKVSKV